MFGSLCPPLTHTHSTQQIASTGTADSPLGEDGTHASQDSVSSKNQSPGGVTKGCLLVVGGAQLLHPLRDQTPPPDMWSTLENRLATGIGSLPWSTLVPLFLSVILWNPLTQTGEFH